MMNPDVTLSPTSLLLSCPQNWPITLVSADGVCVPAPASVSPAAAYGTSTFLRHAMLCGETLCLVPVARTRTIELFWEYLSLSSLTACAATPSQTQSRCGQQPRSSETRTPSSAVSCAHRRPVDVTNWGHELDLTYRDAWLEAEAEAQRQMWTHQRARASAGAAAEAVTESSPSPSPPTTAGISQLCHHQHDKAGSDDHVDSTALLFPYALAPLHCGGGDVGGSFGADVTAYTASPFSNATRRIRGRRDEAHASVAAASGSSGQSFPQHAAASRPSMCESETYIDPSLSRARAEAYAAELSPLLAAPACGASDSTNAPPAQPLLRPPLDFAAALTPAYDLSECAVSLLDVHFVRHVVVPHLDAPRTPTLTAPGLLVLPCPECAASPLTLSCAQQQSLLELLVLAEWIGHNALYRVCVYALTSWLSQTSVEEMVRLFQDRRHSTGYHDVGQEPDECAVGLEESPTSRTQTNPMTESRRGGRGGGGRARGHGPLSTPARGRDYVKRKGNTRALSPTTTTVTESASLEAKAVTDTLGLPPSRRIQLLSALKQNPSWLLPTEPLATPEA